MGGVYSIRGHQLTVHPLLMEIWPSPMVLKPRFCLMQKPGNSPVFKTMLACQPILEAWLLANPDSHSKQKPWQGLHNKHTAAWH